MPYIPRFVARAEAFGLSNLVLFCLDEKAMETCLAVGPKERPETVEEGSEKGRCVPGTPSILNKFTLREPQTAFCYPLCGPRPLVYLWLKVDVFWQRPQLLNLRDMST